MKGRPGIPVLLHNVRLASPLDSYAQKLRELQEKRSKDRTETDHLQIARVEWEGGMYYDDQLGPCLTIFMIYASLAEGARRLRKGTKVEQGVLVKNDGLEIPIQYDGPRKLDELWDANFRYTCSVAVGTGKAKVRVERTRPAFRDWQVVVPLMLDETELNLADFQRVAQAAGRVGIGDYRRFFGKYDVKVEKVEEG
jgi:hypothetical protein